MSIFIFYYIIKPVVEIAIGLQFRCAFVHSCIDCRLQKIYEVSVVCAWDMQEVVSQIKKKLI